MANDIDDALRDVDAARINYEARSITLESILRALVIGNATMDDVRRAELCLGAIDEENARRDAALDRLGKLCAQKHGVVLAAGSVA